MKKMKSLSSIFVCAFVLIALNSTVIFAQAPDTLWTRAYGSITENDYGASLLLLFEGGCLITGTTFALGGENSDIYLLKINSDGDTLWTRTYGGEAEEYGYSVINIGGGIVVAGETYSFGAGDADCYLVRTSSIGDTFWTRTFGGEERDSFHSVISVQNGYLAVGETWSYGAGSSDVYIVATMFNGDSLWTKAYGGIEIEKGNKVIATSDTGYAVLGYTQSFVPSENPNFYLLKLDQNGDTLWTRNYGGIGNDNGRDIIQLPDGGYLLAGNTDSYGAGLWDFYLIRTDENGDTLWTRTYGGADSEELNALSPTTDGAFILAGTLCPIGPTSAQAYFVKVDSLGNELWSTAVEIEGSETIADVAALPDFGCIGVGKTGDEATDGADLLLLRLEGEANLLFGNQRGILSAGEYIIVGETFVTETDSLILEPGVVIKTAGDFDLRVNGYFSAVGTEADSIRFLPADTVEQWGGVVFEVAANEDCEIGYCHFTGSSIGAINIYQTDMEIHHCLFENNEANWGGGIYISYCNPYIHDCIVSDNVSHNNGGGIYATHSSPVIENCLVFGNHCDGPGSGFGGGGICYNHESPGKIERCIIYDNYSGVNGGGVSLNDQSHGEVINCTISGNETNNVGGGIFAANSAVIIKNTIVEGNTGTTGVYLYSTRDAVIDYCDFFGNELGEIDGDTLPPGLGEISTVNLNGDSCDAFYNLLSDPLFVDPMNSDFNLTEDSPCIDAGDPLSAFDPDTTIADIGALFYNQGMGVGVEKRGLLPERYALHQNYPNPFNPVTTIRFDLPNTSKVKLEVFDILGEKVITLIDRTCPPGCNSVRWDGSELASGLYICRFKAESPQGAKKFASVMKMLLIK